MSGSMSGFDLQLINAVDVTDGTYITVDIAAGDVAARVTVQDGVFGEKVTVTIGGESHELPVPKRECA